jgi:serine/threonine-protein kinase
MSASPSPSVPVKPGDVVADKYRVDRILGVGGMGFVVAATNLALSKHVALKMMLPEALRLDNAALRFEREARAAAALKSEHVAEVLDIGKLPSGVPYIVMEFLEGSDLEHVIRTNGPLPVTEAVLYLLQACEAIAEAHSVGIVHRDLKLRNIFLTRRLDGSPLVKVLDFGISKWNVGDPQGHALTRTNDVMGSPTYMSPEQVRSGKDVDHRTDIWALGVVLFELLTGRAPFLADTLPGLCALVLEQPAPAVSSLRGDVPPSLVAAIARCLEKTREARFQSIAELVTAIAPFARSGGGTRALPAAPSPAASTFVKTDPTPAPLVHTNGSWGGTSARPASTRPPWLTIALVLGGLTTTGVIATVGLSAFHARPETHPVVADAAPLPTPALSSIPSASPSTTTATSAPEPSSAPSAIPRPVVHPPVLHPSSKPPPLPLPSTKPTSNPLTPDDRK